MSSHSEKQYAGKDSVLTYLCFRPSCPRKLATSRVGKAPVALLAATLPPPGATRALPGPSVVVTPTASEEDDGEAREDLERDRGLGAEEGKKDKQRNNNSQ